MFDVGIGGAIHDGIFGSSTSSDAKRIGVSSTIPPGAGEFASHQVVDPSLPPFYLEGQGESGNTRAFAALNCAGSAARIARAASIVAPAFCNSVNAATGKGVCGDKITCAQINEKCITTADCCQPATGSNEPVAECIGGFCGFTILC